MTAADDMLSSVPDALRERARPLNDSAPRNNGPFVLYWMHHAARAHENPALEAAIALANELGIAAFVHQGIGGGHRFNSDRHHTFIMQGARDVQRELRARGVGYSFHLPRTASDHSPLSSLTRRAAIVVVEDFPAPPFSDWSQRIAERCGALCLAVDSQCIVPMQSVEERHTRAFRFRDATKSDFAWRTARGWPLDPIAPAAPPLSPESIGLDSIDFGSADIASLCAECDIDHSVGPVPHTPGGSRAGCERWERFRDNGLRGYAARRNDAARDGVSRLSPYLHHGHISPFRIAKEASEKGGKGAEKFLDELLIWREMSHNFCFHTPSETLESLDVLPEWAQRTLEEHSGDAREAEYSWETLARGRTGDRVWDAAQRSLVIHGELHNNLRMTWGKTLVKWADSPKRALRLLIDLNHRFALDGNDPNSYGGLLWCLGQFDRPFKPPKPILGTVRPRDTATHADRLDLDAYERRVLAPAASKQLRIGVIGAGVSGLAAARILQDHGHAVRVFDKGRGPGGRIATRREGDLRFDHGAQYFTARHPVFRRHVMSWLRDGDVARWNVKPATLARGDIEYKDDDSDRFVGAPGMNAVAKRLAADLEVACGVQISEIRSMPDGWRLLDHETEERGDFDIVIAAMPPTQAASLLRDQSSDLVAEIDSVDMDPCWSLMVEFESPLPVDFDAAFVKESLLSWIARDGAKPARDAENTWIMHASPDWSREHLKLGRDEVAALLLDAFAEAAAIDLPESNFRRAHRWRFAQPRSRASDICLFDHEAALGACGDWCAGGRVEGAFLSGVAIAGRVLTRVESDAAEAELFQSHA